MDIKAVPARNWGGAEYSGEYNVLESTTLFRGIQSKLKKWAAVQRDELLTEFSKVLESTHPCSRTGYGSLSRNSCAEKALGRQQVPGKEQSLPRKKCTWAAKHPLDLEMHLPSHSSKVRHWFCSSVQHWWDHPNRIGLWHSTDTHIQEWFQWSLPWWPRLEHVDEKSGSFQPL